MSQVTTRRKGRIRRSASPLGYWIDDKFIPGFEDDPGLPAGLRRRLATWARTYTPEKLSETQRDLLATKIPVEMTAAQREAERLGSVENSPYWQLLTRKEQDRVRAPSRNRKLRDAEYPLTIGQLTTLTGASTDQVRHWHELGLLRASRSKGGHRQFHSDAVMRAFVFNKLMPPAYLTALRDVQQERATPLLAGLATVLFEQAPREDPQVHDLYLRTAQDLQEVSRLLTRRSVQESAQHA
jgi:hypothetical protein